MTETKTTIKDEVAVLLHQKLHPAIFVHVWDTPNLFQILKKKKISIFADKNNEPWLLLNGEKDPIVSENFRLIKEGVEEKKAEDLLRAGLILGLLWFNKRTMLLDRVHRLDLSPEISLVLRSSEDGGYCAFSETADFLDLDKSCTNCRATSKYGQWFGSSWICSDCLSKD